MMSEGKDFDWISVLLTVTFANSLGLDQVLHVGPDLDLSCLTL